MWEININLQLLGFIRSVALGAVFCLLYDVLRSYRKKFKCTDIAVFWQDIIYLILCAPITFCFLLAITNGELRAYVFLGIALGFFGCRFSISFIFIKIFSFCFSVLKRIFMLFSRVLKALFSWLDNFFGLVIRIFDKNFKKVANSFKKGLKNR